VISIAAFNNSRILDKLIFWPPAINIQHQYYRFITCGLVHADFMHLLFNMITLYFFGKGLENHYMGILGLQPYYYPMLYVGALIASNIPTYIKKREDYNYRSLCCAVPGLFDLYVKTRGGQCQSRCASLGLTFWYPLYHRGTSGCG
jgi:membrane associated rhomboid family serine protease